VVDDNRRFFPSFYPPSRFEYKKMFINAANVKNKFFPTYIYLYMKQKKRMKNEKKIKEKLLLNISDFKNGRVTNNNKKLSIVRYKFHSFWSKRKGKERKESQKKVWMEKPENYRFSLFETMEIYGTAPSPPAKELECFLPRLKCFYFHPCERRQVKGGSLKKKQEGKSVVTNCPKIARRCR